MATFQKPENALKRAEELIEVGKKQDALDVLHAALQHRKFRNLWTPTIESIILRHLELCTELQKMRTAREGLVQYRTMCQAANISSLETVVQSFRKFAEEKVNKAIKATADIKTDRMEDFDELESPQTILLRAIQSQDTRQQSQDGDVHSHFRFLWDSYKAILDILKSNVRLESVYHETAQVAFEFCKEHKRPQEFKRLCVMLRTNFEQLFKRTGPTPAHQVNPNSPDTITKTMETRCLQLQAATQLELWREAYLTAEDMHTLMQKVRPKPGIRSMYFDFLGQIFWKSENYLFHAFACLKNLLFVKAAKSNLKEEELLLLASKAVLSTLCVPFARNTDLQGTLELTADAGQTYNYEKAKRMTQLFPNVQSVPTRDTIVASIQEKMLLQHSATPCQRLFALIESDFTPLSLCQDAKPFLDELSGDTICGGKLSEYVTPMKQIIFFRLMKQLSEVYSNMTIENFERAASIVPFSVAEKWMASASRAQGISVQINYSQRVIVFGAPKKVDLKSMRQPLIDVGHKLQQAMQRIAPEDRLQSDRLEKQQLSSNISSRLEDEHRLIRQRKEEIERRKEESEKRKEQEEKEALEKLRRQEARDAEAERKRKEEERRRRETERLEQKRRDEELAKNKELLAQMKKQAEQTSAKVKVGGKKITEIVADDLEKIGFDQIEKAREDQVQKERAEKIRQRKLENKRVDHLARALREEEVDKLQLWAEEIEIQDKAFLEKQEELKEEELRAKHAVGLEEKAQLERFASPKDKWVEEQLQAREEEYQEKCAEREDRLMKKVVENMISRAKIRKEQDDRKRAEERAEAERERKEEQRRRDEEARRRREEEEAEERRIREEREAEERRQREEEEAEERRLEKERKDAERAERRKQEDEARARQDEKRKAKEAEIEARLAGGNRREEPKQQEESGGSWRDRAGGRGDRGAPRRDEDDGGGWRRSEPEKKDEKPTPWRRGEGASRAAPARDEGKEEGEKTSPWRRGQGASRAAPARDEGKEEEEDGGWRKQPARGARAAPKEEEEEPLSPASPEPEKQEEKAGSDDEGWEAAKPKKKKGAKAAAAEAPPADEDGEWKTAGGPRRSSAGTAAGGDAGRRPTPPWKRKAAAGGAGGGAAAEKPAQSREAWKSRGQGGDSGGSWR